MRGDKLERLRVIALERGGLLALMTLLLYVWLAPPYIVDGDNAEFSTLGMLGGVSHPSGYPLYLLWLRAMQWLPGSTPAHTAALATAILGAASILAVHAACRAWGAAPLAATIAAAILAGAPIIMRCGTRAEVFALNNLVVATVIWLAANAGPLRGGARAFALGVVAGLGLSNHMTCALIGPVGILGVVRGAAEAGSRRRAAGAIGLALAGLVIGLLPYLYLVATPETALSWGKVSTFDDVIGMVTRRDYGGPGAFLPGENHVSASQQLVALVLTLGRTWLWAPLVLGLVALAQRIVRPAVGGETRWAWALLAGSFLVSGPILASRFNIDPAGLGLYVIQRFHILPALLLAVPVSVGLTSFGPYIKTRITQRVACGIAATLGLFAAASLSLPHLRRVHTPAIEQYATNVLSSLPPNAVLFAGQDGQYFGMGYVQYALGVRPDVTVIAWQLTGMPWYAHRMMDRGVYAPDGKDPAIVRVVDYLLTIKRPVFMELTKIAAPVIDTHATYPYGPVARVLPRGETVPSADDVLAENKRIYDNFVITYDRPGSDDEFATAVHTWYAAPWKTLARKLDQIGRHEDAAFAAQVARDVGPQP